MGFTFKQRGSFSKTESFLSRSIKGSNFDILNSYGEQGVRALANATPIDSGLTAESWTYEVVKKKGYYALVFHNTHMVDGKPIAILIQYGHATGTGGYVQGRDYINPAVKPIFDKIAKDVWKAVNK